MTFIVAIVTVTGGAVMRYSCDENNRTNNVKTHGPRKRTCHDSQSSTNSDSGESHVGLPGPITSRDHHLLVRIGVFEHLGRSISSFITARNATALWILTYTL